MSPLTPYYSHNTIIQLTADRDESGHTQVTMLEMGGEADGDMNKARIRPVKGEFGWGFSAWFVRVQQYTMNDYVKSELIWESEVLFEPEKHRLVFCEMPGRPRVDKTAFDGMPWVLI